MGELKKPPKYQENSFKSLFCDLNDEKMVQKTPLFLSGVGGVTKLAITLLIMLLQHRNYYFLERKLNSASNDTFFSGLRVFDLSQYFCVFFILRMSRRDFLLTQHFFLLYFFSRVIWPDSEAPVGNLRVLPFHRYIIRCASWPETTRRGHDTNAYLIYQKRGIFPNNLYGMG